ncbi:MAG: hypothetical protein Q4C30_06645 [Bacteroidia bacterium]|nr:hypothetical protein [Bacteroidia bacterium]
MKRYKYSPIAVIEINYYHRFIFPKEYLNFASSNKTITNNMVTFVICAVIALAFVFSAADKLKSYNKQNTSLAIDCDTVTVNKEETPSVSAETETEVKLAS